MNSPVDLAIPDVQNSVDGRHLAIDKVGIKAIQHPVKVADKSQGIQHTIANFNMYVELPHNFKGTHMSRFVEILNEQEREISVESFEAILRTMQTRVEQYIDRFRVGRGRPAGTNPQALTHLQGVKLIFPDAGPLTICYWLGH